MPRPDMTPDGDETLDSLAGGWKIFQLRHGHRYATDDVLVAWTACRSRPKASHVLDLGSGVGSVGLMTLLRLPPEARLTTVEVQSGSAALQRKTVIYNGLEGRVEIRHGDLRDSGLFEVQETYELITSNPPYFVPGHATPSPYPHRAAARLELNGDIFDFCRVGAQRLTGDGCFCFCYPAGDPRPEEAINGAGLKLKSKQDVIFREGHPPVITLFSCGHRGEGGALPTLTTRTSSGTRSETYRKIRVEMLIEE